MPQKPVYARAPILAVSHCFPCNGTVRTTDERVRNLYTASVRWIDNPYMWEGLFRIACLIKNKPMDEPVTTLILNAVRETENGSAEGCLSRQVSIIPRGTGNCKKRSMKKDPGKLRDRKHTEPGIRVP